MSNKDGYTKETNRFSTPPSDWFLRSSDEVLYYERDPSTIDMFTDIKRHNPNINFVEQDNDERIAKELSIRIDAEPLEDKINALISVLSKTIHLGKDPYERANMIVCVWTVLLNKLASFEREILPVSKRKNIIVDGKIVEQDDT